MSKTVRIGRIVLLFLSGVYCLVEFHAISNLGGLLVTDKVPYEAVGDQLGMLVTSISLVAVTFCAWPIIEAIIGEEKEKEKRRKIEEGGGYYYEYAKVTA
jgi:hypothetical protein